MLEKLRGKVAASLLHPSLPTHCLVGNPNIAAGSGGEVLTLRTTVLQHAGGCVVGSSLPNLHHVLCTLVEKS